jgi:uridine phosphorylase
MLRDLTRDDWLGILGLPQDRVPTVLVLRGTRNLRLYYGMYRGYLSDVQDVTTTNGVLEDVCVGDLDGVSVAYASVYGAPMASEVVHVFGVLGTSLVIQTGCCGTVTDEVGLGDLLVATEAYRGEGASQYYMTGAESVRASFGEGVSRAIDNADGGPVHYGRIYTTSALLAEGKEEVEAWSRDGFSAVDMETAATFAVADHFGMDRVSVLYAFDSPMTGDHMLMADSDKSRLRALGNKRVMDLAFAIAREHGTER